MEWNKRQNKIVGHYFGNPFAKIGGRPLFSLTLCCKDRDIMLLRHMGNVKYIVY